MDVKIIKLYYKYASGGGVVDTLEQINSTANNPSITKIINYANDYLDMDTDMFKYDPTHKQNESVPVWKDIENLITALHQFGKSVQDIDKIVLDVFNATGLFDVIKYDGQAINPSNLSNLTYYALRQEPPATNNSQQRNANAAANYKKIAGGDIEGEIIKYFQDGQYANDVYAAFINAGNTPPAAGKINAEFGNAAQPDGSVRITNSKITATNPELQKWALNAFKAFGGSMKLQKKLTDIAKGNGANGAFTLRTPNIVETSFE